MEISKKTWHYKIVSMVSHDVKNGNRVSFCKYFWSFIFGVLMVLGGLFALALVSFVVGTALLQIFLYFFGTPYTLEQAPQMVIGFILLIVGTVLSTVYFGLGALKRRKERLEALRYKHGFFESKPKRRPSLIYLRYRAWKDKVCPIIEFVKE